MSCLNTSTAESSLRSAITRTDTAMSPRCLQTRQLATLSTVLSGLASLLTLSSHPFASGRSQTGWRSPRWLPSRRARHSSTRLKARWRRPAAHTAHHRRWAPFLRCLHTTRNLITHNMDRREARRRTTRIYGGFVGVSQQTA
jgi:hypothetical protein